VSYSLVVFDFDGTLADSFAAFVAVYAQVAPEHGLAALDPARLEALRGLGPRVLLRELQVPLWKVPGFTLAMRQALGARSETVALFDGATDLLRDLRRHGVRTAIVSSNSQENVQRVLGRKYAAMIDHYGCGATLFGKRRKLRETLAAFDFAPRQVLCVGDEVRDAEAAAGLGLDFAGVAWGFATPAALAPFCRRGPCADFAALREAILAPG
jgi:phosphoglycolate phosphatase